MPFCKVRKWVFSPTRGATVSPSLGLAVVLAATRYQMEAMQERYKDLTFRETVEIGES